jgi:hypothetical protein
MVRLKVLPLQKWMKKAKEHRGTPTEVLMHRDGVYLMVDGGERKAWFEYKGKAYTTPGLEASILLEMKVHLTPLLRSSEREALELLEKQHLLKKGDRLHQILTTNLHYLWIRSIRRGF